MSPVSRVRKKQSSTEEPEPQSLSGFFKDVLGDYANLGTEPGHLEVELLTSELMGQWWETGDDLGPELVELAADKGTAPAAAFLAAFARLADDEDQRAAASEALAAVVKRGLPEPEWAAALGEFGVGECWRTADVYGDASSLLCVFGEGDTAHGVLALLDFVEFDGWVKDVVIVEAPDEVLAEMRTQAAEGGDLMVFEQVTPGQARLLLEDGIAITDSIEDPEVSADFSRFRALALARARSLGEPEQAEEAPEFTEQDQADALAAFFAFVADDASEGDFDDNEATRAVAEMLVEFGAEHDPRRPLRVGPEKLAFFLDTVFDGDDDLGEDVEAALPDVVRAWAEWGARRDGLSEGATETLLGAVDEVLEELAEDDSEVDSADVYLDGTESADDPEALVDLLARRMFAIPDTVTVIGDDELELDPTDAEQRRLLVVGEFPEYHESLAGDDFDEQERMQLAMRTTIVDQLWDNDPAAVWEAAKRLGEKGLEREEVFSQLEQVLAKHLEPATESSMEFDLDDYEAGLSSLG